MISIIIPVYNGDKTIAKAIESCLGQSFKDFEILIIDNCSADNTKNIVLNFNDCRVKYYYLDKKGRSSARNYGIKRSSGNFVLFLDADDEILDGYLERANFILSNNRAYVAYCCNSLYSNSIDSNTKIYKQDYSKIKKLTLANPFPINSIIACKSVLSTFNESLEYNEDWLFWFESLYDANIFIDKDFCGAKVNIHECNTMKNRNMMIQYEMLVRAKIRKEIIRPISLFYYASIIKQMYIYLLINNRCPTIEIKVKEVFFFEFLFVKFMKKIKFIDKILYKKYENFLKNDPYM